MSSSVTSGAAASELAPVVRRATDRQLIVAGAIAFSIVVLAAAGGSGVVVDSWPWLIAGFALSAASLFLVVGFPVSAHGLGVFAGTFAALIVWTGLSAIWSIAPGASLHELERTALYVGSFAVGAACVRLGGAAAISAGVALGATAIAGYSLVEFETGHRTLLNPSIPSEPIGYGNALAVLSMLGAIASISLAARENSWRWRLAWLSPLVVLSPTIVLTNSLGTALAAAVAVGVALVIWGGPIIPRRIRPVVLAASALVACAVIGVGALLGRSHLTQNDRVAYWRVAAKDLRSHLVVGSGAGTYALYWRSHPEPAQLVPLEAHSLYLETGAELGAVGLALLLATVAFPVSVILRRERILALRDDPIRFGAVCAYVALILHAAVDWDWEIPVLAISGIYFAAILLSSTSRTSRIRL